MAVKTSFPTCVNFLGFKFEDLIDLEHFQSIKYELQHIEIPNYLNITCKNIEFGNNYILGKNITTNKIFDAIELSRWNCLRAQKSQPRNFGYQTETDYKTGTGTGHNVLFMNDCISEYVYAFYEQVLFAMLENKRKQIVFEITNDALHYPWQQHIHIYNKLESRVIEYIVYETGGDLGWHIDDWSNITMVIMLTNNSMYTGGQTQMRNNNESITEQLLLSKGDILIFDSSTEHRILPILNGYRHVLVFEFWILGRSFRNIRSDGIDYLMDVECIKNGLKTSYCWKESKNERMLRLLNAFKLPINITDKNNHLSLSDIDEFLYFIQTLIDNYCNFILNASIYFDGIHSICVNKGYGYLSAIYGEKNELLKNINYNNFQWYSLINNIENIFKCNQGYKKDATKYLNINYLLEQFYYDTYYCFNIDEKHKTVWDRTIKVILNFYIRRHINFHHEFYEHHLIQYLQYTLEALTHNNVQLVPIWVILQVL